MERTTFLKNYRIRLQYDGTPYQPVTAGPSTSYEAVDERTGEPVSVTLIPAASIDPAQREGFEGHISAAQKLQHVNIGSIRDFGHEGDDYIYVSERLAGETLATWVRSHGPMPADAALRVHVDPIGAGTAQRRHLVRADGVGRDASCSGPFP